MILAVKNLGDSFHMSIVGDCHVQGTLFMSDQYSKEIQIIIKLFLVCHLLLHTKSVPSQPASNVGGLVIH